MLPTLEQFHRDGAARVRVYAKLDPGETLFGGVSLTGRGGEIRGHMGVISAQLSHYDHHVTVGVPNWASFDLGEDYCYGPMFALTATPSLRTFLQIGGEIVVFHPLLGPISRAVRPAAEEISIIYDDARESVVRTARRMARRKHSPTVVDGWVLTQNWNVARRKVERAEAAAKRVKQRIDDATPDTRSSRALRAVSAQILRDAGAVRTLAKHATHGRPISRADLRNRTASLERRTLALEFVDGAS
ncbi:MAG: hypothetical protein H6729_01920 [Deltaproteobacteria bacterium]|nr:hypothetical protein [Deltaproteobacteria bacterium]